MASEEAVHNKHCGSELTIYLTMHVDEFIKEKPT